MLNIMNFFFNGRHFGTVIGMKKCVETNKFIDGRVDFITLFESPPYNK